VAGFPEITHFRTRKAAELLAFLALHRGHAHPREAICELLWPDDDPLQTRHRLSVALSSLRAQFEPRGIPPGSFTLTGPAPAGGLVVILASGNPAATVAASATVAPRATSATFPITTQSVAATTDVPITVSYDPDSTGPGAPAAVSSNLNVKRAELRGLSFSPSNVVTRGSPTTLVVTLTGPAPSGGTNVDLTSSDKYVVPVPNRARVAAGQTSLQVNLTTRRPKNGATAAVTVTGVHPVSGGFTRTATITVTQ